MSIGSPHVAQISAMMLDMKIINLWYLRLSTNNVQRDGMVMYGAKDDNSFISIG